MSKEVIKHAIRWTYELALHEAVAAGYIVPDEHIDALYETWYKLYPWPPEKENMHEVYDYDE